MRLKRCDKISVVRGGTLNLFFGGLMNSQLVEHYKTERVTLTPGELSLSSSDGIQREVEAFLALSINLSKVPLEVIHLRVGNDDSLPVSVKGKTLVRYVGTAPAISVEPDQHGNLQMTFMGPSVVEVIFNSEKKQSRGKNRGAHGQKKIYVIQ